jgi:hypothetical protein
MIGSSAIHTIVLDDPNRAYLQKQAFRRENLEDQEEAIPVRRQCSLYMSTPKNNLLVEKNKITLCISKV